MKTGDRVRHKLTNETMTVVSVSETVARLKKDIPTPWKARDGTIEECWTAVCLIENLELIDKQLTIFTP